MREFMTAAKKAADPEEWIEFKVDDTVCRALAEPKGGQIAYLMAHNAKHVKTQDRVAAMLNFFDATLDDKSQSYLSGRMLDGSLPISSENDDAVSIEKIIAYLMEVWSGRPTQASSGSTGSPENAGPSSQPPTPPSTWPAPPPTISATSSTPGSTSEPTPRSTTGSTTN